MIFILAVIVLYIPIKLFFPTKVIHKENMPKRGKKAIATSNHYSNWDPIIYDAAFFRKFRVMSKKELYENKFLGFILKGLGAIIVDRDHMSPSTYKATMNELNKNHQVFIFPEGTRNKAGTKELLEIKSGFLAFASRGECEITPMLLYRKPKFLRKNYIIVGKPFVLEGENPKRLTKEELELNLERYLQVMSDLRKELDDFVENKKRRKKKN